MVTREKLITYFIAAEVIVYHFVLLGLKWKCAGNKVQKDPQVFLSNEIKKAVSNSNFVTLLLA